MGHDRPRWRFRLSTLMLLVVIAALATYIVVERWQRVQQEASRVQREASRRRMAVEQRRAMFLRAVEAEVQRCAVGEAHPHPKRVPATVVDR